VQFLQCTTAAGTQQTCQYNPSSTTFVSMRAGQIFNGWNISGFVDNLFNTHVTTNFNYTGVDGYNPTQAPSPLYRNFTFRPRTIGVTATYRY
jgi:hypothetical protein